MNLEQIKEQQTIFLSQDQFVKQEKERNSLLVELALEP